MNAFDELAELFRQDTPVRTWMCRDTPWRTILQRAALFELPINPEPETFMKMGGRYNLETSTALTAMFFLPFPEMIVEDNWGCVALVDDVPDQHGLFAKRHFLIF